ncbi:MAG: hypothetical protein K2X29_11860, partial [Candidatus Obscuribacterales bacterium]|nr:hypothetical protein [Candidatus Obscuribacterales bacterium]
MGISDLDLSSARTTLPAAVSGTIGVGGEVGTAGVIRSATPMTVSRGQLLTPSQIIALSQTQTGGQKLLLSNLGSALAGTVVISPVSNPSIPMANVASSISTLVVPQGVTLSAIGFSQSNSLNVSGASSILGSLFALQTRAGKDSVLNFGNDLHIGAGGILSGLLPRTQSIVGLFPSQNLILNVVGSLTNNGSISVPGSLYLNVAGVISNATISGAGNASITAQNINVMSGVGTVFNSGLISALDSINIGTSSALIDLNLNSTGGTIQALNTINLRDLSYSGSANIFLTGGDWLSKALDVHAGSGTVLADIGQITSQFNSTATAVHLAADSDSLILGSNCINGDPLFVNTNGNVEITGTINVTSLGEPLTIVARGSIIAKNGASLINHGGDITLIAGANIDESSYSGTVISSTVSGSPPSSGMANGVLTIEDIGYNRNVSGHIDFENGAHNSTVIDTSSNMKSGGNITMVAQNGGVRFREESTINSSSNNGRAGDILILAGGYGEQQLTGSIGFAIKTGNLQASGTIGGASQAGQVSLYTQSPSN